MTTSDTPAFPAGSTRIKRLQRSLKLGGTIIALSVGVIVPVLLSTSVGIIALVLGEGSLTLVFGVLVISFTSAAVELLAGVPGEASHFDIPADQMLVTSYDGGSGAIGISYTPACDSNDHNIYYGDLFNVAAYDYTGEECDVGVTGTASFIPTLDSTYFLIVANNDSEEGSYGHSTTGERPEDIGTPVCDHDRNLGGVTCE